MKENPRIAVFAGSAADGGAAVMKQTVSELGAYLAGNGMVLTVAAHSGGTVRALADAVRARGGRVYEVEGGREKVISLADAVVFLPGGVGMFTTLFTALERTFSHSESAPVGVLNADGFFDPLLAQLEKSRGAGFIVQWQCSKLHAGKTPEELFGKLDGGIRDREMFDSRRLYDLCRTGTPEEIESFMDSRNVSRKKLFSYHGWQTGPCRALVYTPLSAAVEAGNAAVARWLLEQGADPDKPGGHGKEKTAREAAQDLPEMRELFEKFGKTRP